MPTSAAPGSGAADDGPAQVQAEPPALTWQSVRRALAVLKRLQNPGHGDLTFGQLFGREVRDANAHAAGLQPGASIGARRWALHGATR